MRRRPKVIHKNYKILKSQILEAFKSLRKKGFIARSNFSCCMSCGSYELYKMAEEKNKIGYVFWHHQSEETFKKFGYVYLYHGAKDEENNLAIARMIANELKLKNIPYTWNLTENQAIRVRIEED